MRLFYIAVAITLTALTGCSSPAAETEAADEPSQFVTVSFAIDDDTSSEILEELSELGAQADEALQAEDVGYLDGDGAGVGAYELFFWGQDHDRMWEILEPIFSGAPVPWSTVQLGDKSTDEWITITPDGEEESS